MEFEDWQLDGCAEIYSLEEYKNLNIGGIVSCTSGGFDPIHVGHISCIMESKFNSQTALVVIVNGDSFLRNKKGKPFMDLKTRCQIVSSIRDIDIVIPFEIENDNTVCKALEIIKPTYFTKGGDRKDPSSIPEWNTCVENGIEVIFNVGKPKFWSSSDFLKNWSN